MAGALPSSPKKSAGSPTASVAVAMDPINLLLPQLYILRNHMIALVAAATKRDTEQFQRTLSIAAPLRLDTLRNIIRNMRDDELDQALDRYNNSRFTLHKFSMDERNALSKMLMKIARETTAAVLIAPPRMHMPSVGSTLTSPTSSVDSTISSPRHPSQFSPRPPLPVRLAPTKATVVAPPPKKKTCCSIILRALCCCCYPADKTLTSTTTTVEVHNPMARRVTSPLVVRRSHPHTATVYASTYASTGTTRREKKSFERIASHLERRL